MPYEIVRDSEHSIVVLRLTGHISPDSINGMFNDCARQMQDIDGFASLVIDLSDTSLQETRRFTQAMIIFHRTSSTFKPDAPIYYAFVGQHSALADVMDALEAMRFHAPTFTTIAEAISYLNLRVGSSYLRQARQLSDTNELETLHISRRYTDHMQAITVEPGTSEFPTGGVLHVEEIDTGQRMLLFPKGDLWIGRHEHGHRKPDMDLSMWGAFHKGVSRDHARFMRSDKEVLVMDTGSTNGTTLNGDLLPAHQMQVLHDGDEVTFGSLAVRVYFQQTIEIS